MPDGKTRAKQSTPRSYEGVVDLITREYPGLSAGSQQIARFFTQNPTLIALESINAIAEKCGVHPSSLVRFAQTLGYAGFKDLQGVFQTRLATAAPGFRERISALEQELSRTAGQGSKGLIRDLVVRDIAALQGLMDSVGEAALESAARLLTAADTIYIAGQLRSEPLAGLLRYLLTMLHRRVVLLDPAGGLAPEMARTMGRGDVLVAIAFRHYAKEVVSIAELAPETGTPLIAITDSALSPLAKNAQVLFTVPEDEYSFSRSLAAPMCLIQCLATATAAHLQPGGTMPHIPSVTEIARNQKARLPRPSTGSKMEEAFQGLKK
jgi:DNA-binding MurR/RpiR family transcriptional regulator